MEHSDEFTDEVNLKNENEFFEDEIDAGARRSIW